MTGDAIAQEPEGHVYLVCDGCGFFYGDIRLYPGVTVDCPECRSEAAWAFPLLDKALEYQAQVKGAPVTRDVVPQATPPVDSRQPIKAWRCPKCGKIDDIEWVGGTHADRATAGLNGRCDGQPEGPFYLVHVDQYLDVMLAERAQ